MSLAEDVELEEFVTMKDDLSGADIKAVCTEAGLLALRERRMRVNKADFTEAREKVRYMHTFHWKAKLTVSFQRFSIGRTRTHRKACTCRLFLRFVSYHMLVFYYSSHIISRWYLVSTQACGIPTGKLFVSSAGHGIQHKITGACTLYRYN